MVQGARFGRVGKKTQALQGESALQSQLRVVSNNALVAFSLFWTGNAPLISEHSLSGG